MISSRRTKHLAKARDRTEASFQEEAAEKIDLALGRDEKDSGVAQSRVYAVAV